MAKKNSNGKIETALKKSPINYMSDLFVVVMVLAWIAVIIIMVIMSVYSTIRLSDTSIWCYVADLVSVPLTAGGAIWMVKNSVQHAIANNKGKQAHMDFPRVPDTEDEGIEESLIDGDTPEDGESEEAG